MENNFVEQNNQTRFISYCNKISLCDKDGIKIADFDFDNINIIIKGQAMKFYCDKVTYNDHILRFMVDDSVRMETEGDFAISFHEVDEDTLNIIVTDYQDTDNFEPYYLYETTKEYKDNKEYDILTVKLIINRLGEYINILKSPFNSLIGSIIKLSDKLEQLRTQLFNKCVEQDIVYLYINENIYEVKSLYTNYIIVDKIDVYTQERIETTINYLYLTEVPYFIFSENDIVIVDDQLFNAGINIGNKSTLEPLVMSGYDSNKSLIIKFSTILELACEAEISLLEHNTSLLKLILEQINDTDIIERYNLHEKTLIWLYRGELYTYNHNDAINVIEELSNTIETINRQNEEVEVLLDDIENE